jgi:hypothetical protein
VIQTGRYVFCSQLDFALFDEMIAGDRTFAAGGRLRSG